jgi:hypothetical protein
MAVIKNAVGTNTLDVNADGSIDVNLNGVSTIDIGGGDFAQNVAQSATHFELATGNTSTTQLAASATFTGTIEEIVNQQSVSLICISDQNGTLTLTQFVDVNGTRISNNWVFSVVAGVPFSKSFTANGNYFRATFTNNGASTTTTFTLNTYYGTLFPATNLGNVPVSLDEVNGTALSFGQKTPALSLPVVKAASPTYSASFIGAVTAAAATDIFTITGSATKTVRVTGIYLTGTQTTAGVVSFQLVRRSTANTAGTSTTATAVSFDTSDSAATAVVRAYTANPTLGTTVGTLLAFQKAIVPAAFGSSDVRPVFIDLTQTGLKAIVLRGTSQVLAINTNGANLTGNSMALTVVWTEE